MAVKNYYPIPNQIVLRWLENFMTKLPNYAATLGISGGTLAQVQAYFDTIKQKLAEVEATKSTLKSIVASKEQEMEAAENYIPDFERGGHPFEDHLSA